MALGWRPSKRPGQADSADETHPQRSDVEPALSRPLPSRKPTKQAGLLGCILGGMKWTPILGPRLKIETRVFSGMLLQGC